MQTPEIGNYGQGANQQPNTTYVTVGGVTFYFSYKTLVAVQSPKLGLKVHENDWAQTTGKHLNWIDGGSKEAKAKRLPATEFSAVVASLN